MKEIPWYIRLLASRSYKAKYVISSLVIEALSEQNLNDFSSSYRAGLAVKFKAIIQKDSRILTGVHKSLEKESDGEVINRFKIEIAKRLQDYRIYYMWENRDFKEIRGRLDEIVKIELMRQNLCPFVSPELFQEIKKCCDSLLRMWLRGLYIHAPSDLAMLEDKLNDGAIYEATKRIVQELTQKAVNDMNGRLGSFHVSLGGRESTSKGSIGHDYLNVKTLNPSAWKRRFERVFQPLQRIGKHEAQLFLLKSGEVWP